MYVLWCLKSMILDIMTKCSSIIFSHFCNFFHILYSSHFSWLFTTFTTFKRLNDSLKNIIYRYFSFCSSSCLCIQRLIEVQMDQRRYLILIADSYVIFVPKIYWQKYLHLSQLFSAFIPKNHKKERRKKKKNEQF